MSLESEFSGAVRCRGLINKVRAAGKHFFQDRNIQTAKLSHFGVFLVVCVTAISSTWPIIILSLRLRSVIIIFKSIPHPAISGFWKNTLLCLPAT